MVKRWRETSKELDRSIFEGERYERNMRGIAFVALVLFAVATLTGYLNLMKGYYVAAVTSPMFIVTSLVMLYYVYVKRKREGAIVAAFIGVVVFFTYGALFVTHGFAIFWTLLVPLAFCYLADVKTGMWISLYFAVLFVVLFYTPLRDILPVHYPDVVVVRFPILFLADVAITIYAMVQYHLVTLRQMDDAKMLLESKQAADWANAAKSEFLASVSHEIRTPINAVLGMNEMILRESAQAKKLPASDAQGMQEAFDTIGVYAEDVRSAGTNLLSIINDILDFSKLEARKVDIVDAPYKLSSLLDDAVNLVLFDAREKGLEFIVDVDETLPNELSGDKVHVRQVIANILTNAVKYTGQGSIRLIVRGEAGEERASGKTIRLRIAVQDTGIGIKSEDVEKLFSKFQRVDLDRNSTIEGTGLGLAISQGLVSLMGGSIQVESEYGVGSTFTIVLDQAVVSDEPIGDFRARAEKGAWEAGVYEETFRAPDAHVLIVDDTRTNLTVAVGLLKATEVRIDTAVSGMQAIELAECNAYDAILMDQRMPEMSGTETMQRIRDLENGLNRETPIICLTADAVIGAKDRYLAEGFTDYLSKPIDGKALEGMLAKYLPDELVVFEVREDGEPDSAGMRPDGCVSADYAVLRAAGIDPAVGLGYCQDDDALYRSLLEEYAYSAQGKALEMARYREEQDWENLSILAHAVKSASKTIGATTLSESAARMEQAADAGDRAAVEEGFAQFMAQYDGVAAAIRRLVPQSGAQPLADDEIMEFFPE